MSRLLDTSNWIGERLAWHEDVLLDGTLSANARMLAGWLMHELDLDKGGCWRAQEGIAIGLGVHIATVRRGLAELVRAGHLKTRTAKGRGKTQLYSALIKDQPGRRLTLDETVKARVAARDGRSSDGQPDPTKDASDAERVAGLRVNIGQDSQSDAPEKVAGLRVNDDERLAAEPQKGSSPAAQYLEDSFTPPFPPRQGRQDGGDSRTNRVRGRWPEAVEAKPTFQGREVREAARKRLGEEGVQSWLDPSAWDPTARAIVCRLGFTANWLARELRGDLKALGVTVIHDKRRFEELMRAGRPTVSDQFEAAA